MKTSLTKVVGVVAVCLAAAGCAGEPETATGTVEMAIVAPGGGGAIYRLPEDTLLMLASTDGFFGSVLLDGDAETITVSVPPGEYNAWLRNDSFPGTDWQLQREAGGATETVAAKLLTPQPVSLTVVGGASVRLTFSFSVADGGTVTFDQGDIDVDVDVTETTSTSGQLDWNGSLTTAYAQLTDAPAPLASRLPLVDASLDLTVLGHVAGPWAQTGFDRACAPFALDDIGAGGSAGFSDLISESAGPGTICVVGGSEPLLEVQLQRVGAPTTDTFSDLGVPTISFATLMIGQLPAPSPFDGTTLDVDRLAGTRTVFSVVINSVSDATTSPWSVWYDAQHTGSLTVTFLPGD